jgi:TRAP transporter TAXI family solute receptor
MIPPGRRSLLSGALATASAPALAQGEPTLNALTARANAGTVGLVSGGVDGTYIRIAADLSAVLDDGDLRVLPIVGKGSVQNIRDVILLRGVDIGIVQSDVLEFARRRRLIPGVAGLLQAIVKLYDEEIHILARPGIERLEQLAGQMVNVDVAGSGTAMTASLLFETLGIAVRPSNLGQDAALAQLRDGALAAMVFVVGKPARAFRDIPGGSGLRFLPVPPLPALIETYLPASLGPADYPGLVPEGAMVETLAVGAALAAYAWQPGTDRHRRVARFVEALQARFEALLRPPRHPKWREVNLGAGLPGWPRFDPSAPRRRVP